MLEIWKKAFLHLANRHFFDFMDDKRFLEIYWECVYNRKLNLKNPKSFNEKLQWLKLYDRKPEYSIMVDKYEVKKYVSEIIGEEHIIPTLGVWEKFEDLEFTKLPDQFVLKCTHDSGGLVICRDKAKFSINEEKKKIRKCLKHNYYLRGREWPYKDVKPRIIAEQYMEEYGENKIKSIENSKQSLIDYKFYCFNGVPRFLYVSEGLENHATAKISFLSLDWSFMEFSRADFKSFEKLPPKPQNYSLMIEIAKNLSKHIPFIRVDLYEINGCVYFSELTFSPCSGMMPFKPEKYDYIIGSMLKI